ncbi:sel1 repeat family protein [Salmonella enterica subsp. enterica]|nr:sel1 repeat family protein [Salmonella enterica subsp. enterica]EEP6388686.1 sel1 repeat family protein [Salmonella enterica subsp. enterica]
MLKNKWRWLFLSLSVATACYAADDVEGYYHSLTMGETKALAGLQALAKAKDPEALSTLGFVYEYGISTPVDVEKAINYYTQACDLGGHYGCYNARYFYQYGSGVAQDPVRARALADKANKEDLNVDAPTLNELVDEIYLAKAAAMKDPGQRFAFLQMVMSYANTGNELLMNRLGFSKSDVLNLAEYWAKDNDPDITFLVGQLYDAGFVKVANKDAIKMMWHRKAAELGQSDAQNILGYLYATGEEGVKQDIQQALKWYERAATQGNKDALTNLGVIYYLGEQVDIDYAKASHLFDMAKARGSSEAWRYLAWMFTNGQYVQADCKVAADYFDKGQSRVGRIDGFLATCEKDKQAREKAGNELPVLTMKHVGTFIGGKNDSYACQLHLQVDTNRIGEVANMRVGLNVKNREGAVLTDTASFAPFGMNTFNRNLEGYERNSFSQSTLLHIEDKAFCDGLTLEMTHATAKINGKDVDLLKTGILTLVQ